jgi:hypothetical protein
MRWLQEFGFEKSLYERPNQKWICGRARDGQCCLAGPDAHGNCTATTECLPLRKGDRWFCSRPAIQGGPCAEGPLPDGRCCRPIPKCCPVRSLRAWRGLTVLVTIGVTTAAILLALGSNRGKQVFSPGELTFAHRSMADNCAECHAGLTGRSVSWLVAPKETHSAHDNSALCLKCHDVGKVPFKPHSLPSVNLQKLTESTPKENNPGRRPAGLMLASFIPSVSHPPGSEMACATCHREHRGEEADLRKLTDNQCQNCHAVQFASFTRGHPQFSHYPFERRTRIIFDHESHFQTHFTDPTVAKFAPTKCVDCHETGPRGDTMIVKPFEATCAKCHEDQIKGKSAVKTGIEFIGLPAMDDRSLKGDYSIGQWPEDADQPLTPFLRLLLAGDPQLRKAMEELRGADLSDLSHAGPDKLKAAQSLAWGIKSLVFDLGLHGQDELIRRISLSLGRKLSDTEEEGVAAFFNAAALRAVFRSAFPNLQKEVLDYRNNGKAAPTQLVPSPELAAPGPVQAAAPDAWASQGGWYTPDGLYALYYRPRGHDDLFLRSWMNLTVDADQTADLADSKELFDHLTAPNAVGLCAKCHSIDDTPAPHVNWIGARSDPMQHGFTHFSHSAHLSLLNEHGCLTCHSMKKSDGQSKDTYASAFAPGQHDPSKFTSNFMTIDKAVCMNCHRPHLVRDDCLLCHNYHIGRFKPIISHANVVAVSKPGSK